MHGSIVSSCSLVFVRVVIKCIYGPARRACLGFESLSRPALGLLALTRYLFAVPNQASNQSQ